MFKNLLNERFFRTVVYNFDKYLFNINNTVYKEGDKVDSMFVVVKGSFKMVKKQL
jgi:CRP-like cAMP-binding protein